MEDTLCRYVAFLAGEGLRHRSIKTYLAGIRCLQIQKSLGNPFANGWPRLEYVLSGIKRVESRSGPPVKKRLPITIDVLCRLKDVWLSAPLVPDNIMLWAAACVGFFGFLRVGEFTVSTPRAYDPDVHLNLSDLALDNHSNPSVIQLRIKQSKTDPFREGINIFLGKTDGAICPVQAVIKYITVRSPNPGPLFVLSEGTPLTRGYLVSRLQDALQRAGLDESAYNGHSFRSGAATTAAQRGLQDSLIQTLGRWRSDAYKIYIKLPRLQLAQVSRSLAREH